MPFISQVIASLALAIAIAIAIAIAALHYFFYLSV